MSANVGLPTPRGSGTSGYVQRNLSFLKPRKEHGPSPGAPGSEPAPFRQRQPDKQILEHDRKRQVEVKVLEERERLEEANEEIESGKRKGKVLSEEEIEERCDALRQRLLKELEEEMHAAEAEEGEAEERDDDRDRRDLRGWRRSRSRSLSWERDRTRRRSRSPPYRDFRRGRRDEDDRRYRRGRDERASREERERERDGRKRFKAYQVHELAEAKIRETDRFRKALGIRDEGADGR
ncbi:hypothetical protein VTN49DRAFT_2486 [Thermomyces lanuginosus]|uniref:uncharacterized protein n=1 Tax=Thermomyces lanuginosus TaxID=5541 RepID=UPI0037438B6A